MDWREQVRQNKDDMGAIMCIRAATIGRFAATAEEFDAYCIEVGVREFGSDTTATIYR